MDVPKLQSRVSSSYIPPHRTQLHPRMHSFPSSFSSSKSSQISATQSREKWWTIAAATLIIPFLFYLFAMGRGIHTSSKFDESRPKGFGIIIDAGSTGSRIHVFEFLNEGRVPFVRFDGRGSNSMKVSKGLVEFGGDPENAGSSISRLVEFAKRSVPKSEWKDTKVWLMATQELKSVGVDARKAILESCRRVLRSSGFMFKDEWATLISGQEEGLYAWVAANYALGTLGGDPQETTGIVEIGETSVQVIFALKEPPPMEFSRMVKLAGVTYNLYAQTKLQFSQDAAWKSLHSSEPGTSSSGSGGGISLSVCIPKGYGQSVDANGTLSSSNIEILPPHRKGNFSACKSEALALLQKENDECLHPPCKLVSSFLPKLRGTTAPPENFFYTSEYFGLVPKSSLVELETAGKHYCEDDWEKLKDEHVGIDETDLLRYCFSSAYIVALLHDGLGIPMDDERIGFANQAGSIPLDWTLGAFILQTVTEPPESEPENLGRTAGNDAVTYFSLLALLFFAILAVFYVSKWRKPQLKTIYDLEKGHYIVTRIPR